MRAPATETGSRQAVSICITASCSSPSPHWRYFAGMERAAGGACSKALAKELRNGSSRCAEAAFITTRENVLRNKLDAAALCFAKRHSESDQIFCVHPLFLSLCFSLNQLTRKDFQRKSVALRMKQSTNTKQFRNDILNKSIVLVLAEWPVEGLVSAG